ncbi:MAG: HAD family phosphatase [Bdellovibrionota bacterium]
MGEKKTFKTLLFDMDGTLVDTETMAAQSVVKILGSWNIRLDPSDAGSVMGKTWQNAFDFLFSKYKIPVTKERAADLILADYRKKLEHELVTIPGSVDAVRELACHFPLGLVSGSYKKDIVLVLDKLGITRCFNLILGAEDYERSKPEPDGYLKAIKIMGSPADLTLVFEDSTAGVSSALAAGLWVVMVNREHSAQSKSAHKHINDLTPVNNDWVISLAKELIK